MTTVAVLGTGIMGGPMARNMAQAKLAVRAWNRTREKAEPLAEHGVTVCADPAEATAGADLLVTMLLDADATEQALADGALDRLAQDAVWVQMGTVGIEGARRLRALAERSGTAFVDAPVLGTKQPAENGELVVLASGPTAVRERCAPVFEAVGKVTRWVGEEPGAGSALKLVVNSWVLALTDAVAEAVALARGLSIDPQLFLDTIEGSPTDSPYAHLKGGAMIRTEFAPSFPLTHALKDVGLVLDAAQQVGVRLGIAAAVRDDFSRAIERGHGDEDMGAAYYGHVS